MANNIPVSIISNIFNPVGSGVAGGLEVFNYYLTKELEERSIDTKLFASGDSEKLKSLVPILEKSLAYSQTKEFLAVPWNYRKMTVVEFGIYTKFIQEQKNDRLIHFSLVNFLPIYLAVKKNLPMITTIHMPVDNKHYQLLLELLTPEEIKKANFIGISNAQAKNFPVRKIIHNGVSTNDFKFSSTARKSYVWEGRIIPEKGCPDAIKAAEKAGVTLEIGGEPKNTMEEEFFQKEIKPLIKENILYKGFITKDIQSDFYAARALIFTPKWDEPFGLIMTEALACGTPVIAYDRGATSEIIQNGVNGFLVEKDDIEGLVQAIQKIEKMSENDYLIMRQNSRRIIEENFSFKKMTDEYIKTYQEIWQENN